MRGSNASARAIEINCFCQTEICDVGFSLRIDEDIRWLQVAMEYAALMGVVYRTGNFDQKMGNRL